MLARAEARTGPRRRRRSARRPARPRARRASARAAPRTRRRRGGRSCPRVAARCVRRGATSISSSSPALWPRLSLTSLKLSMSRSTTATSAPRRASSACSRRSRNRSRLGRPVEWIVQGLVADVLFGSRAAGSRRRGCSRAPARSPRRPAREPAPCELDSHRSPQRPCLALDLTRSPAAGGSVAAAGRMQLPGRPRGRLGQAQPAAVTSQESSLRPARAPRPISTPRMRAGLRERLVHQLRRRPPPPARARRAGRPRPAVRRAARARPRPACGRMMSEITPCQRVTSDLVGHERRFVAHPDDRAVAVAHPVFVGHGGFQEHRPRVRRRARGRPGASGVPTGPGPSIHSSGVNPRIASAPELT